MPFVVAANLNNNSDLIPKPLINFGIRVTNQGHFTFCKVSEPESVKRVLIILINAVLEKLE
jgi:phosphoenolpyruvate carboxylase